jgi:hypothetical protein
LMSIMDVDIVKHVLFRDDQINANYFLMMTMKLPRIYYRVK